MAGINDRNRARKTYSFFRSQPVPVVTATDEDCVLTFATVTDLSSFDVTSTDPGEMAFVEPLRDFFFLEKTVTSGSTNNIDTIAATPSGVWYRMGLGGQYWKHQTTWYIDTNSGNDQNLGSIDAPLATHDELVRRLLGVAKLNNDYTVHIVTGSIVADTFGMDVEFDGGSITYYGGTTVATASLGTITSMNTDVDYTNQDVPNVVSSGLTGDERLLYVSGSGALDFLGVVTTGLTGQVFTTPIASGSVSDSLWSVTNPRFNAGSVIIVRGLGEVRFVNIDVDADDISVDPGSTLTIDRGRVSRSNSGSIKLYGGSMFFNDAVVENLDSTIVLGGDVSVIGSRVGFVGIGGIDVIQDANIELGSAIITSSSLYVNDARLVLTTPNHSGSALHESSLNIRSNSDIYVKNLISTGTLAEPVRVHGQKVAIFFDDVEQPKANMVAINNGTQTQLSWSQMPYNDMLRDTLIVSGALENS